MIAVQLFTKIFSLNNDFMKHSIWNRGNVELESVATLTLKKLL